MKNKFIRILSLLLIGAMLLPMAAACKKDPDEEKPDIPEEPEEDPRGDQAKLDYVLKIESAESDSAVLTDWTKVGQNGIMYLDTNTKYKNEPVSLFWHATSGVMPGEINITNWAEYDTLCFSVYSPGKCGATVQIRISGPNVAGTNMDPYFRYQFTVDWEGWKDFAIPFDDLSSNYNPTLNNLNTLYFDCSGWDMTPNSACELNFSRFKLSKRNYVITPSLDTLDNSIFTKAKDNWRKLLVGTAATNSSGTENVNSKIASVDRNCKNALDRFDSTFQAKVRDSLFGYEIVQGKAGDESKINSIYSLLYNM
ncbi:MAG: hypothetical protein IJY04_04840, partial [Clostridia bacterium]|nr:hypothetical protein [Clostridia bacterium]